MTMPPMDDERGGYPRDLTKRILALGLGAYFLTEDTVRRYVKDAKIPRDIARSITQNANKGKEELYGFVARELSGFLKQMDLQQELDRFVASHKIRVNAEIEFVPRPRAGADKEPTEGDADEDEEDELEDGPIEWNVSFRAGAPEPVGDEDAGERVGDEDDDLAER